MRGGGQQVCAHTAGRARIAVVLQRIGERAGRQRNVSADAETAGKENDGRGRLHQTADRRSHRAKIGRCGYPRDASHCRKVSRRHAHPEYPPASSKKLSPALKVKPRAKRDSKQLVILTGLSGSGKSTVLKAFEDMGFYCVDNMPVELIPIFA